MTSTDIEEPGNSAAHGDGSNYLNAEKGLKSWLFTVSRNHCLDILRKQAKMTSVGFSEIIFVESEEEDRHEEEERLEQLRGALHALKEHQRTCVVAFYLQGQNYEQVAEKSGFTMKEVKSYLQNGRRNLRLYMERKANESAK